MISESLDSVEMKTMGVVWNVWSLVKCIVSLYTELYLIKGTRNCICVADTIKN